MAATEKLSQIGQTLREALPELQRAYGVQPSAIFELIARDDVGCGVDVVVK